MHVARRHQPQYIDLLMLGHLHELASMSAHTARRSWWTVVSLLMVVALLFGIAGAMLP